MKKHKNNKRLKYIFGIIVFLSSTFLFSAYFKFLNASEPILNTSDWKIIEAIDGDTLRVEIPSMSPLKFSIRINGIDTPEKGGRARCEREAHLARKASEFTKKLVKDLKTFKITNVKHDKYGGRLLADVEINDLDVARALQREELARIYHGEAKLTWCMQK